MWYRSVTYFHSIVELGNYVALRISGRWFVRFVANSETYLFMSHQSKGTRFISLQALCLSLYNMASAIYNYLHHLTRNVIFTRIIRCGKLSVIKAYTAALRTNIHAIRGFILNGN